MSGIGAYAPRSMFHGGSVNKMGMMYNPVTGNYDIPHDADAVARAAEAAASGGGGMGGSDSEAEEKGERRRCGSAHTLLASARKGRRQRRSPRRRGGRRGHPLMEPVDAFRLVDVSRWACACVAEASWWCSRPRQAAKA